MQVGTSVNPLFPEEPDYAFISADLAESPRIAPIVDLPQRTLRQKPKPLPEGISRYGAIPASAGRGLPTALPVVDWIANGVGFAVMSGIFTWSRLHGGQVIVLPDKEFRYLRHSCYSPVQPIAELGGQVISA